MSIEAYEQMSTGVSDITSIALVTLEIIQNALLNNELRLWFACRELLGNLAARKHWLDNRSQCEAPDYCPTSVYEPQDCPFFLENGFYGMFVC